jgi:hypothetical protein
VERRVSGTERRVSGTEGESPHEWDSVISTANPEIFSMADLIAVEAAAVEKKPRIGRQHTSDSPRAESPKSSPRDNEHIIKAIRRNTIGKLFNTSGSNVSTMSATDHKDSGSSRNHGIGGSSSSVGADGVVKASRRFSLGDILKGKKAVIDGPAPAPAGSGHAGGSAGHSGSAVGSAIAAASLTGATAGTNTSTGAGTGAGAASSSTSNPINKHGVAFMDQETEAAAAEGALTPAPASVSIDPALHSRLVRMLSSIGEEPDSAQDVSGEPEAEQCITLPQRRMTSSNIISLSKSSLLKRGSLGGLATAKSSGPGVGGGMGAEAGHTGGAAKKAAHAEETTQVPRSFSLAKLFSDKGGGEKGGGRRGPVFLEDTPEAIRSKSRTAAAEALLGYGKSLSAAVDLQAGWQAVQQCNSLNSLIAAHKKDSQFVDDVASSGICAQLVSVLLRFSDDILVSEACLDVICVVCSRSGPAAPLGSPHTHTHMHTHTAGHAEAVAAPLEVLSSEDKITPQFSEPDTFTALNAVLYHCGILLAPLAELALADEARPSLAPALSFATGASSFASFDLPKTPTGNSPAIFEEDGDINDSFAFSELNTKSFGGYSPKNQYQKSFSDANPPLDTGAATAGMSANAGTNEDAVKEGADGITSSIATVINLAARTIGLLSSHLPNALSIAACGVYDNLLKASKTLVGTRSDIAAEVCWAMRCLAANRLSSAVKKLFISSADTISTLVTALVHYKSKAVCRGACRAIVNLCALDPQGPFRLLSARITPLLSKALVEQMESPETVKWITMSFSSLFMNQQSTRAGPAPSAASLAATAAAAQAVYSAPQANPAEVVVAREAAVGLAEELAAGPPASSPVAGDEGGGFIAALRSKSSLALFRRDSKTRDVLDTSALDSTVATAGSGTEGGGGSPLAAAHKTSSGGGGGFIQAVRSKSNKALFRGGSSDKGSVAVTPAPAPSAASRTKHLFGMSSSTKASQANQAAFATNAEVMNRLRRSTSTIAVGGGGGWGEGEEGGAGLEDPEVAERLLVRPVLETGLCRTLVSALAKNGPTNAAVAEWLCFTIYLLALKETLLVELGYAHACAAVIDTISTYSGKSHVVMRRACTALGSLCVGSAANRDEVYKLSGHLFVIKSLLAHGGSDIGHSRLSMASRPAPAADLAATWTEELSIVQECWCLKKLGVDGRLRHSMMNYSIFEAMSAIVTKFSGHIDISLQCIKLLLVLITREEEDSLQAVMEFKQKVSLKAFLTTMNKCSNDVTMTKYSLILLSVLCCRFIPFKSIESSQMFQKDHSFRKPSARDLHMCTSRSCGGWHGPYIDEFECDDWTRRHAEGGRGRGRGGAAQGGGGPAAPLCGCRSRPCERVSAPGTGEAAGAVGGSEEMRRSNMFSHYSCCSLPEMQNALLMCRAADFIVTCMTKYAHYHVSIAEWGCRAAYAMTVEGRGGTARLTPLLRRDKGHPHSHSPKKEGGSVFGATHEGALGASFGEENNFRMKQFAEDSLETDILRKGEIAFGGVEGRGVGAGAGIPLNSFSDDTADVSDIILSDRPYHGYFQRSHRSSLESHRDDETFSFSKDSSISVGTSRMLNGDGVNFRTTSAFLKLDFCRILSEVMQTHTNNELAVVWTARATSNMLSTQCYIDPSDGYNLLSAEERPSGGYDDGNAAPSRAVLLAKECNLLDSVFQLLQRASSSVDSNPAMCQYLCETVYVLSQDPMLSAWLGGLGMCHVIFDVLEQYLAYFSVCQAALLAIGGLAKTCPDNATRFHTETDVTSTYEIVLTAIRTHRCEHSPGVAEEGFLAALYLSSGSESDQSTGGAGYTGAARISEMCPMVVSSVLEYHNNDLGVCLAALHFVRRFTVGSEADSAVIGGNNGSFFKILVELMQRRVEVVCGCIESAEVRMGDILVRNRSSTSRRSTRSRSRNRSSLYYVLITISFIY